MFNPSTTGIEIRDILLIFCAEKHEFDFPFSKKNCTVKEVWWSEQKNNWILVMSFCGRS